MKIIKLLEELGKWINLECSNNNIKLLYSMELKCLKNFPENEIVKMFNNGEFDFYEKIS